MKPGIQLKGVRSPLWRKILRDQRHPTNSCRQVLGRLQTTLGLSPFEMAEVFNCSIQTLQAWRMGRRNPSGPARTMIHLLHVLFDLVPDEDVVSVVKRVWGDSIGANLIQGIECRTRKLQEAQKRTAKLRDECDKRLAAIAGPMEEAMQHFNEVDRRVEELLREEAHGNGGAEPA